MRNPRIAARWRGVLPALVAALVALVPAGGAARAAGLDLGPYRGKVVYLDFWASWCGPCRESFPWLSALAREFGPGELVVIGVNVDKDRQRAQRFLEDTPAGFPIVYDPDGRLAAAYQITGMPSAVLIDRQGRVRFQHVGFSTKKEEPYENDLRTLLDEKAP